MEIWRRSQFHVQTQLFQLIKFLERLVEVEAVSVFALVGKHGILNSQGCQPSRPFGSFSEEAIETAVGYAISVETFQSQRPEPDEAAAAGEQRK